MSPILTFGTFSKSHWSCCWLLSVGVKKEKENLKKNSPEIKHRQTHTLLSDQPCVEDRLVLDAAWPVQPLKYRSDNKKQYETSLESQSA